jgi:hypothetical protein
MFQCFHPYVANVLCVYEEAHCTRPTPKYRTITELFLHVALFVVALVTELLPGSRMYTLCKPFVTVLCICSTLWELIVIFLYLVDFPRLALDKIVIDVCFTAFMPLVRHSLHVSAFAGHLQAEYTISLGTYPSHNSQHLEELLRKTVLPITLIKYAQQDVEPQNKN